MKALRVLLITEPSGGGSGRHVVDLARGLVNFGCDVILVYSSLRAERQFVEEISSLKLRAMIDLPMARQISLSDAKAVLSLRRIVRKFGPFDIVHAHSSKAGALLRLTWPERAKYFYTPHALKTMDPNNSLLSKIIYGSIEYVLAMLNTEKIIAVSPDEADHAVKYCLPRRKIVTIPNGSDPVPSEDRKARRGELGVADGEVLVGFVGRLCEQKDPLRFIEAVAAARKSNPKVRGVMFGDGELRDKVVDRLEEGIELRSGEDARPYFCAFDIFMLTSRYEAMPYVFLEALHAGNPIISASVGGATVAVDPGSNGIILPSDAEASHFSDAVINLATSEKLFRLSKASRVKSLNHRTENMVVEILRAYDSVLS